MRVFIHQLVQHRIVYSGLDRRIPNVYRCYHVSVVFKIMLCKIIHVYITFLIFLTVLAGIGRINTPHFDFKTPKARSTSFLAALCCLLNFISSTS
ncbi:hypothetical protein Hdeb2414_s0013g00414781 [Helianthus debilis subsp. tardiflorus]